MKIYRLSKNIVAEMKPNLLGAILKTNFIECHSKLVQRTK